MSNRKVIFLDVDGTLIDYRAIMPESAGRAVDEARKMATLYIFVQAVQNMKSYREISVSSMA